MTKGGKNIWSGASKTPQPNTNSPIRPANVGRMGELVKMMDFTNPL
jgi:hypothetical protein